jgi:hypothetical protein
VKDMGVDGLDSVDGVDSKNKRDKNKKIVSWLAGLLVEDKKELNVIGFYAYTNLAT